MTEGEAIASELREWNISADSAAGKAIARLIPKRERSWLAMRASVPGTKGYEEHQQMYVACCRDIAAYRRRSSE